MPTPPSPRAVRAPIRVFPRRSLHLLALAAVALPLVIFMPAATGVPGDPPSRELVSAEAVPTTPVVRQVVTVIDGPTMHIGVTDAPTVVEALRSLGVERSLLDRIDLGLMDPIDGPTVIRISRVEIIEQRDEVELPRQLIRVEDPQMLRGLVRVDRAGRVGSRTDTSLVLTVDGEVESRLTLLQETTKQPVDRLERVGTRTLEGDTVWDALARCESSGRWDVVRVVNSRISYHGGLQFDARTWAAYRPEGFPALASEASREQQIEVAELVLARQGWGAWPACARRLGLR